MSYRDSYLAKLRQVVGYEFRAYARRTRGF
jgi:hypothetical protein